MKTKTQTTTDPAAPKKTRQRDPLVAQREERIRSVKEKVEKTIRAECAYKLEKVKVAAAKSIAEAEAAMEKAEAELAALLAPTEGPETPTLKAS